MVIIAARLYKTTLANVFLTHKIYLFIKIACKTVHNDVAQFYYMYLGFNST